MKDALFDEYIYRTTWANIKALAEYQRKHLAGQYIVYAYVGKDGRIYFGSTNNILTRRSDGKNMKAYRRGKQAVWQLFEVNEYTRNEVLVYILATATTEEEIHSLESSYIASFRTKDVQLGYNRCLSDKDFIEFTRAEREASLDSLAVVASEARQVVIQRYVGDLWQNT